MALLTGQTPTAQTPAGDEPFRGMVHRAIAAERAGFDSIWVSEHHFTDDGYLTSPLVAAAAMAGVTSRIRIGTGVVLAPLHHPVRLAEDAATVQLVSGDRLLLGMAIGYRPEEFPPFGVRRQDRVGRLHAAVDVCRRLHTGQEARGAWFRPVLDVRPPMLLGGHSPAAIRRAVSIGDGYLTGGGDVDHAIRLLDVLAVEPHDRDVFHVGIHLAVVLEDAGVPTDVIMAGAEYQHRRYTEWMALPERPPALVRGTTDQVIESISPVVDRLGSYANATLLLRLIVPGVPAAMADQLVHHAGSTLLPAIKGR
ncbi:LLM class flavin-dependent oxidoreductase [Euzebya sp.]|uniref:LLM class flavin-dependent oxidoreductase n=1 Tax=Euzebya sp. TaxID=1971409 RepID=UPI003510FCCF